MIWKNAFFSNLCISLVWLMSGCFASDAVEGGEPRVEARLEDLDFEARRLLRGGEKAPRYEWDRAIESCLNLAERYPDSETGLFALELARRLAAQRALFSKDVIDHRQAERLNVISRRRHAKVDSGSPGRGDENLWERAGGERLPVQPDSSLDEKGGAVDPLLEGYDQRLDVVKGAGLEGVVVKPAELGSSIPGSGLKDIVCSTSHSRSRIVFHFDGIPDFEYGVLQPADGDDYGRIFIDIPGSGLNRSVEKGLRSCKGAIIRDSRHGKQPGGKYRIVFEIFSPSSFRIFPLTGNSLVLHVSRRTPEGVVPFIRSVALDPGHGGENKGAVGPSGLLEKDVALGVARAAARRLTAHRISVVMTRQSDEDVSLEERTAKALAAGSDLFVSIHANADPGGRRQAVDTFYLNTGGDEYSRRLAQRENESGGRSEAEDRLVWAKLLDGRIVEQSKALAREVHPRVLSAVRAHLPKTKDGGIRKALFHVLLYARMPGILVELSHISHPLGEEFLGNPRNWEVLGEAIAAGIVEYIKEHNSKATDDTPEKRFPPVRPVRPRGRDGIKKKKKVSRDKLNVIESEEGTIRIRR